MVDTIKIATVNCQGLGTPSKRQDVLNFYKSKDYSIICFQDTHFTSDLETIVETQWGIGAFLILSVQIHEGLLFFLTIILN